MGLRTCVDCKRQYDGMGRRCRPCDAAMQAPRRACHLAVKKALAAGSLTRQPCEVCGNPAAVAHHDDYSKPLEVRWLCRSHHRQYHADLNRALGGHFYHLKSAGTAR